MANPTLLTSPIAENGDKNVIPATTGATTGLLDQEHGFQQINELPIQAGGLPPQRKDFNGAFNLLSKILFYIQKGYVFDFDENQDYYAGCVVKDTDGGLYCANADVPASSTHPKDDATNWALINFGLNKKETFTSSGSFIAPVTGVYKITLQGGGGGGAGCSQYASGSGGGQGGYQEFYEKLTAGTLYPFTIGAGGTGGTGGANATSGSSGGASSITIGNNTYLCNGGGGATYSYNVHSGVGGDGGKAYVNSAEINTAMCGAIGVWSTLSLVAGGFGGGPHGGGGGWDVATAGQFGSGGQGGSRYGTPQNGAVGGDGYITFEYCNI